MILSEIKKHDWQGWRSLFGYAAAELEENIGFVGYVLRYTGTDSIRLGHWKMAFFF